MSQRTVNRIVKKDFRLICMKKRRAHELTVANKQARLDRSHLLMRRYPASLVHFIWFTDEKLFTVKILKMIDCMYIDLMQKIITRKLELFGHICRMENDRKMKSVVFGRLDETNKRGWPDKEYNRMVWCINTRTIEKQKWRRITRMAAGTYGHWSLG